LCPVGDTVAVGCCCFAFHKHLNLDMVETARRYGRLRHITILCIQRSCSVSGKLMIFTSACKFGFSIHGNITASLLVARSCCDEWSCAEQASSQVLPDDHFVVCSGRNLLTCACRLAPPLLLAGTVLFSGSLYALVLSQKKVQIFLFTPFFSNHITSWHGMAWHGMACYHRLYFCTNALDCNARFVNHSDKLPRARCTARGGAGAGGHHAGGRPAAHRRLGQPGPLSPIPHPPIPSASSLSTLSAARSADFGSRPLARARAAASFADPPPVRACPA
jgi:hypothetical protein